MFFLLIYPPPLRWKLFKKCDSDKFSLILKDESKKLVSCLHLNLKNQSEAFENEKNQLYDFIEKLSTDFEDLFKKSNLSVEIPSKKKK